MDDLISRPLPCGEEVEGRAAHSVDVHRAKLYAFGGWNGLHALACLQVYQPSSGWKELEAVGELPQERNNHASAVCSGRLYIHGGHNGVDWLSDFYSLTLYDKPTWKKIEHSGTYANGKRACHTLSRIGLQLLLFGGFDGEQSSNELLAYDTVRRKWSQLKWKGKGPSPRNGHSAVVWKESLVVFGGHDGKDTLGDMWVFDLKAQLWSQVQLKGKEQKPLKGATACIYQGVLVLFGGVHQTRLNDLSLFSLADSKWLDLLLPKCQFDALPSPRQRHAAARISNKMYVFGGFDGNKWLPQLYEFDLTKLLQLARRAERLSGCLSDFRGMLQARDHADVCFVTRQEEVWAHRVILAGRSEYFSNLFKESSEVKITIKQDSAPFKKVISFLYSGELQHIQDRQEAIRVLYLADLYLLDSLKEACEDQLLSLLGQEGLVELLLASEKTASPGLRSVALQRVLDNLVLLYGTSDFRELEEQPGLAKDLLKMLLENYKLK